MGIKNDPICQYCEGRSKTVTYFARECCHFVNTRWSIWGKNPSESYGHIKGLWKSPARLEMECVVLGLTNDVWCNKCHINAHVNSNGATVSSSDKHWNLVRDEYRLRHVSFWAALSSCSTTRLQITADIQAMLNSPFNHAICKCCV